MSAIIVANIRRNSLAGVFTVCLITTLVAGGVFSGTAVAGTVFDVTVDYSSISNPNGVWSAGIKLSLTDSSLVLFDVNNDHINGANSWNFSSNPNDAPGFAKNLGLDVIEGIAPGQTWFHPGNFPGVDELATVRFTAPWTGEYALSSQFLNGNVGETTGYVYLNDVMQFTSLTSTNATYANTFNLAAGDRVDFMVDRYTDSYVADATGLSASFSTTAVPEPSSFVLTTTCVGVVMVWLRRRSQRLSRS